MRLGDGGRTDDGAEIRKDGADWLAEGFDDAGFGDIVRERRQVILQMRQVIDELLAEDIATRRKHLTELDKSRAQLLEGEGVALTGAARGFFGKKRPQQAGKGAWNRRQVMRRFLWQQGVVMQQDKARAEHAQP